MKRFVISDIHGSYDEMISLFEYAEIDFKKDQLVVAGDMINRGPKSGEVLREIMNLNKKNKNVHVLLGNHEEMMNWYLTEKDFMWLEYDGKESIESINDVFKGGGISEVVEWVRGLPLTFEDENFVYSHAGIDIPYGVMEQDRDIVWRTEDEFFDIEVDFLMHYTKNKPIVYGHTPKERIILNGKYLGVDRGARVVKGGSLALVELNSMVSYEYNFSTKSINKVEIRTK